jgi:hypothetical protein
LNRYRRLGRCRRTLAFGGLNTRSYCCSKKRTGKQASKYETRFNSEDYMIALKW